MENRPFDQIRPGDHDAPTRRINLADIEMFAAMSGDVNPWHLDDAVALCKMAERGQITGGILDGPLALDNAVSEQAARVKKIASPVAGRADILVVPDLEAGNMLFKQLTYFAGADGGGIVMGARVPVILTSRPVRCWT